MSTVASIRAREATARATTLLARTAVLGVELERNRLEMAARRLALHDTRRSLATTLGRRTLIEVSGTIDGVDVAASWIDGRLVGSVELVRRAEMLVALGEQLTHVEPDADEHDHEGGDPLPRLYVASLAGPPIAVALTLMRACTRVTSVQFPIDPR